MSYAIIGRLREARFRGVSFLVKNSEINFGQQTVTHQYPDSDKTTVEYLGLKEDQFELTIYVHGAGLIEKRNRLKEALKKGADGTLIHPYEGEVNCAVISARVVDADTKLRVSSFSVVFQKSTPQDFPEISTNTKPGILNSLNNLLNTVEDSFDNMSNDYSYNSIENGSKLNDLTDTFDTALRLTYKLTDRANLANEEILDFKSKISTYASAPSMLKRAFTSLFSTINLIASNNREQTRILKQFYDFGDNDREVPETTLERAEKAKNFNIINKAVKANSLGLAYSTASQINFENTEELDEVRQELEDQYEAIKENLENEVLQSLQSVRDLTLSYFDNLDLNNVITHNTNPTSLILLTYALYGNLDNYQALLDLNNFKDPNFIQGEVKILSE